MRVVLHAGLHKSGTTTIQNAWRASYSDGREVWYPAVGRGGAPGHHAVLRPLLTDFISGRAPDLEAARLRATLAGHDGSGLARILERARRRGAGTLVLSSEDLDRARPEDVERLRAAFRECDVNVVLTVTRPVHRWCSGWQTLVKHGLASYPAEVTELLADFAALNVGRLEELVRVLGAPETLIRVVRTSPAEPDLAQSLASALGLPDLKALPPSPRNSSLGRDTEVLLRLNRCGRALGLDSTSAGLLAAWGSAPRSYLERPELVSKYELPGSFDSAASQEAAWLRNAPEGVTVLDPTRALDGWGSRDVPEWYADASRREACVPERLEEESEAIQLWRARQQVQVLTRRALPPETRDV